MRLSFRSGLRWLILALSVVAFLWFVPQLQGRYFSQKVPVEDRPALVNEYRRTWAQVIGGFGLLLGLYLTWRRVEISQDQQVTERFTRAIDQLGATDDKTGDPRLEVRLGGIYALERIARDSPDRDYSTVMEVLTAYVRENSPRGREGTGASSEAASPSHEATGEAKECSQQPTLSKPLRPTADIQAILDVLKRAQTHVPEKYRASINLQGANLQGANLQGADLQEANLFGARLQRSVLINANLQEADLEGANLSDASLQEANIRGADLRKANLREATLQGADLRKTNLAIAELQGAFLRRANLQGSILRKATLQSADLQGADLQKADLQEANLFQANLLRANLSEVNLQDANLLEAYLPRANLMRAHLPRADLRRATLRRANLEQANLLGAHFQGADLQRADLKGAKVSAAQLANTHSLEGAILPYNSRHD